MFLSHQTKTARAQNVAAKMPLPILRQCYIQCLIAKIWMTLR